jgi:hypothetical protein
MNTQHVIPAQAGTHVIPAKAGIQGLTSCAQRNPVREPWVPAFAGMTEGPK